MKSFYERAKKFLINNNTQIFLSSIMLFIVTISYIRYNQYQTDKNNKYDEMTYKLDSISYESYRLENIQQMNIIKEDSILDVQLDSLDKE